MFWDMCAQIYSPHLDTPSPRWVYVAHGILLFLYQVGFQFLSQIGKRLRTSAAFALSASISVYLRSYLVEVNDSSTVSYVCCCEVL